MKKIGSIVLLLFSTVILAQENKTIPFSKEDNTVYSSAGLDRIPTPEKGHQDFAQYIAKNFNYSAEAIKNGISGKIFLEFIVEKNGKLNDIRIIRGLGHGLDEEAVRLFSNYGNWIPGQHNGRSIRVRFSVPITIRTK